MEGETSRAQPSPNLSRARPVASGRCRVAFGSWPDPRFALAISLSALVGVALFLPAFLRQPCAASRHRPTRPPLPLRYPPPLASPAHFFPLHSTPSHTHKPAIPSHNQSCSRLDQGATAAFRVLTWTRRPGPAVQFALRERGARDTDIARQ